MAGIYFWLPKISGRMWYGTLGYWVSGIVIVGLNLTFFPMHFLGMIGMPRRTHTYLEGTGWQPLNLVCTIGAFILAFGILFFLIDIVRTLRKGTAGRKRPVGRPHPRVDTPRPRPPTTSRKPRSSHRGTPSGPTSMGARSSATRCG